MSTAALTPKQAAFRDEYKRNIATWYNGWGHLLSIFVPGIAVVWYCASQVENPTIWELLFVIPVLVFYNFNEWWLHRNAMHRPIKGLGGILMPVYHRHTHQHHQYFTSQVMTYDSNREWRIVLFPPYALLVFMLLTLPAAIVLGYLWSANAGYVLMMLTPIYYLNYETFHLCCHVHDNWFVRNCPLGEHHPPASRCASQPADHDGAQHEPDLPGCRLVHGHQRSRPRATRPFVQRLQHNVREEGVSRRSGGRA